MYSGKMSKSTIKKNGSERFHCPHPDCNKSFTRQEHLSRHKLNHWPKQIYTCHFKFPNSSIICDKTFVRKDLLTRHEKRHYNSVNRRQKKAATTKKIDVSTGLSASPNPIVPSNNNNSNNKSATTDSNNQVFFDWLFDNTPKMAQSNQLFMNNLSTTQTAHIPFGYPNSAAVQSVSNVQFEFFKPTTNYHRSQVLSPQNITNGNILSPVDYQNQHLSSSNQTSLGPSAELIAPIPFSATGTNASTSNRPNNRISSNSTSFPQTTNFSNLFAINNETNSDPLQAFLRDLYTSCSSPFDSKGNSNNRSSSLSSNSSNFTQQVTPNIDVRLSNFADATNEQLIEEQLIPQAQNKFQDDFKATMKDNISAQKSNINELKKGKTAHSNHKKKINRDTLEKYKRQLKSSLKLIFHKYPASKFKISREKCEQLYTLIPELRFIPIETIETTLKSFWINFHPQYGLLHKPSFEINSAQDILILALIMTGASYLGASFRETISDPICGPLRWIIFSHSDFQPPSKNYIIQSLLLLEKYEKTCTNRYLHERSYLHHATTLQLLRRTSSLGGRPFQNNNAYLSDQNENNNEEDEFKNVILKWVEFESLKRVAFFAFYMDVSHATVFGYVNLSINFKQVQLDLPCADEVWESYDLNFDILKEFGFFRNYDINNSSGSKKFNNVTFLNALKSLMRQVILLIDNKTASNDDNNEYYDCHKIQSLFGKKILLAGIISISFQCQEENIIPILSNYIFNKNNKMMQTNNNYSWREITSFAYDYWLFEIQKSCNQINNCFIANDIVSDSTLLKTCEWNFNNNDCKLPIYHMAQVVLRTFHHDYFIYAGAPWRMNVKSTLLEYNASYSRILNFAKDSFGDVTIIYALQFLFQLFIIDDGKEVKINSNYDINTDIFATRPFSLAVVIMIIWSHCFILYGPETTIWENYSDDTDPITKKLIDDRNKHHKGDYVPLESFENYLIKLYDKLYVRVNYQNIHDYQDQILKKAKKFKEIEGTHLLAGFLKYMVSIFDQNYWDLGREYGKLFSHCLERTLGKKDYLCNDMYDV